MVIKSKIQTGHRFIFYCRGCCKKTDEKKEFEVYHMSRKKGVLLRCLDCGFKISRNIKRLEEQIERGEK